MIDIAHLPKSMQKRPEIRALSLRVYPGDGPRHYRVPGTAQIYDVYAIHDTYYCGCKAGSRGARCAHIIATQRYRAQQETLHGDH